MKKYIIELIKDELLALKEALDNIDDHSWMIEEIERGALLPGIYEKIYDLMNPIITELEEERYKRREAEENNRREMGEGKEEGDRKRRKTFRRSSEVKEK